MDCVLLLTSWFYSLVVVSACYTLDLVWVALCCFVGCFDWFVYVRCRFNCLGTYLGLICRILFYCWLSMLACFRLVGLYFAVVLFSVIAWVSLLFVLFECGLCFTFTIT